LLLYDYLHIFGILIGICTGGTEGGKGEENVIASGVEHGILDGEKHEQLIWTILANQWE
jgi:hypothetical protein